ncbi:hypothetical protein HOY34_11325 [Xinfangfangia sp. D13-10-4-6]|uniref:hypothetical protein n=1 Tax=Pseudogemmobacter hezensis TaxID=2737662 RepID=UPI00155430E3|nr:hypothetical protein [Pseudogemmobacter hezensis]NPD15792.1 hypothetical protein [Pseudogemmobacter hezensis]
MAINITEIQNLAGFIAGCLVDSETGLVLASEIKVANFDVETAAAANTDVVKAKIRAMASLGVRDSIEDILITLGKQYHLIRPLASNPAVFLYVVLERASSNLGIARITLKNVEAALKI